MEQEEERVRAEAERLEQLRAAKARIDRERAEAAREAEEERQRATRAERAELDAKKAAAIERARVEALAQAEATRRAADAEERLRLAALVSVPTPASSRPRPSRFGAGLAAGALLMLAAAAVLWFAVGAPRFAGAERSAATARADLEQEREQNLSAHAALVTALDEQKKANASLRADNDQLRRARADEKPAMPRSVRATPRPPPPQRQAPCNPHDPLCGDLDAR